MVMQKEEGYKYKIIIKALSAVAATQSPIIFIGSGEHFDDFEAFDAQSFIKRLLGLGDVSKLFNVVKDAVSQDDQNKMLENLKLLFEMQAPFNLKLPPLSLNQHGMSFFCDGTNKTKSLSQHILAFAFAWAAEVTFKI